MKRSFSFVLILWVLLPNYLFAQNIPELNDSASTILSDDKAQLLGQQLMRRLRVRSNFSDDLLLLSYVQHLADRLASEGSRDIGKVKLSLIIDSDINAFAVPGGYISINSGLVLKTKREDELAAVIAHEIGHHTQRHMTRLLQKQKQLSFPALAALIGGVLIGGQAGTAAIVGSQAVVGAKLLAYSRTFEREADASGMKILSATGFKSDAMPAFFDLLESQSRLLGRQVPSFLQTHPVSTERIADGRRRAEKLQRNQAPYLVASENTLDYAHAKARLLALYARDTGRVLSEFAENNNAKVDHNDQLAAQYGLALVNVRTGSFELAKVALKDLLKDKPDNVLYLQALGQVFIEQQDYKQAHQIYSKLYARHAKSQAVVNGHATVLMGLKQYDEALRVLRKMQRRRPQALWTYNLVAHIYGEQGKYMHARFATAEQLFQIGSFRQCINLIKLRRGELLSDDTDYLRARVKDLSGLAQKQLTRVKQL